MTTTLLTCLAVPHLLVQLATTQLAIAPPVAVVAHDAPHAPVLDCCAQAAACGVTVGMAAGAAQQRCAPLQVVTLAPSILTTAHATIDAVLGTFGDVVTQQARNHLQSTSHCNNHPLLSPSHHAMMTTGDYI
jgi:hypothetical protein